MFILRHDFRAAPHVIYDGVEAYDFPLGALAPDLPRLRLNVARSEVSRWRHYFNDAELNALSRLLGWEMRFLLNREVAFHPGFAHLVNLYPLLHSGEELILSYAHDERSAGHFTYWLVAVVARAQTQKEFERRVGLIEKHWR